MFKATATVIATVVLAGCGSLQKSLDESDLSIIPKVPNLSDDRLCSYHGRYARIQTEARFKVAQAVDAEIQKRSLLNEVDSQYISKEQFSIRAFTIGSSECAVLSVLGWPEEVNKTVTSSGTHIQYVFKRFLSNDLTDYDYTNVYVSNGVVTSWQE